MKATVKKATAKRRTAISKGIERICSQKIEWQFESKGVELSDMDIENIQNMIIDNSLGGDLRSITPSGIVCGFWNICF